MLRIRRAAAISEKHDFVAALNRGDPEAEHLLKRLREPGLCAGKNLAVIVQLAVKVI